MAKKTNLDFKTAGFWPAPMKLMAYGFAFIAVLVLGWLLWFSSQYSSLTAAEEKELALRDEYEKVRVKANNLPGLKKQLEEINGFLKILVNRLPNENEIPELVVNVSQAAIANNLQVDLFEPQNEIQHDFYAEKRINVKFRGSYHELGAFFSEVARQPRLVSVVVDDMKLNLMPPEKSSTDQSSASSDLNVTPKTILSFQGSVRTYRYLSADEEAAIAAEKQAADKKAGAGRSR